MDACYCAHLQCGEYICMLAAAWCSPSLDISSYMYLMVELDLKRSVPWQHCLFAPWEHWLCAAWLLSELGWVTELGCVRFHPVRPISGSIRFGSTGSGSVRGLPGGTCHSSANYRGTCHSSTTCRRLLRCWLHGCASGRQPWRLAEQRQTQCH